MMSATVLWLPPSTAPKDGRPFLADVGMPWTIMCMYSLEEDKWVCSTIQVNMVGGTYNDPYFENEWLELDELKAWIPLHGVNN